MRIDKIGENRILTKQLKHTTALITKQGYRDIVIARFEGEDHLANARFVQDLIHEFAKVEL